MQSSYSQILGSTTEAHIPNQRTIIIVHNLTGPNNSFLLIHHGMISANI